MWRKFNAHLAPGSAALLLAAWAVHAAGAQPAPLLAAPGHPPEAQQPSRNALLDVPLVNNIPGAIEERPHIANPMANDPASVERGMKYFNGFNCVGCHAPNGGGGMGPSLSDGRFKFGSDPASHFVVIAHGAPLGMPAWGTLLPEQAIWDLVSYIDSISRQPSAEWGQTVSPAIHQPPIEQVPAEFSQSTSPWRATEPFKNGQNPQK